MVAPLAAKAASAAAAKKASKSKKLTENRMRKQAKEYRDKAATATGAEKRQLSKAATRLDYRLREIGKLDAANLADQKRIEREFQESSMLLKKSQRSAKARGDVLGKVLLNGTNAGSRFFSMTQEIWVGVGYDDRYTALQDAFDDLSISEIIEQFEKETKIDVLKGRINDKKYKKKGRLDQEEIDLREAGMLAVQGMRGVMLGL